MNCAKHPDVTATAFCRECGTPMCTECQRPALGSVYCQQHSPIPAPPPPPPASGYAGSTYAAADTPYAPPLPHHMAADSPYHAPVPPSAPDLGVHPALALILGFCPGVGAIYNGQYAKGLIHAVIFGLLVSIVSNSHNSGMQALFGIMIGVWVIYMAFEAFHTARQRRYGVRVEEFSSLFETRHSHGRFPAGAIALIGLGFILLLDTTDIISMAQFERFWPVLLIFFGLYMLYARLNPSGPPASDGVSGTNVNSEVRR